MLAGACEHLATPAPLGPFADVARRARRGRSQPPSRPGAIHATSRWHCSTSCGRPAVLVIEDAHWADEATLDVLRVVGRRIAETPSLVVVTFRDEVADDHPLRILLGDLASAPAVERLEVPPLTPEAVCGLAAPHAADCAAIFALSRRATRSSSRSSSEQAATRCRRRFATPCSRAQPGFRRRPEASSSARRSCPRGPSSGCSRRPSRRRRGTSTNASPPACSKPVAARSRSATSSPASRSRAPSRRTGAASSTPRSCGRSSLRRRGGGQLAARTPRRRGGRFREPCSGTVAPPRPRRRAGAHREAAAQYARVIRHAGAAPAPERADSALELRVRGPGRPVSTRDDQARCTRRSRSVVSSATSWAWETTSPGSRPRT